MYMLIPRFRITIIGALLISPFGDNIVLLYKKKRSLFLPAVQWFVSNTISHEMGCVTHQLAFREDFLLIYQA